ncbi:reverse transcriptase domain-containing protein [Tanacetum coccineum]
MLSNPEVTGRLLKWRFELEEHDIHYRPRTSVKGQILADFIVERPEDDTLDTPMEDVEELPDLWVLFTDGSSCIDGSEAAEYEALIAGLRIAGQMGIKCRFQTRSQPVPRGENKKSDALSKITSTSFAHLSKQVLVEELKEKSIDEKEVLAVVEEDGHTWMTPVYEYLTEEILQEEKRKARVVHPQARKANYVLREIHEGSCSMHSGSRSVVVKALRSGYYWTTMHMDARNLIRECSDCQVHHPMPRNPQEKLTPITSPWPFYKWRIDIAGPFLEGPGKVKFLIVAMDYFTKWIKATNGLVERANRSLGEGIKARLGEKNKNWIEEISHVLWAHRTMIKSSNEETPFSLTYGAEVVIPVEISMPTLRTTEIDMIKNNEAMGINLDLLEEKREQAAIQEARSKAKMEKNYNARVQSTSFRPRDLVYQNNKASHAEDGGKLGPKWEGPYEVTKTLGKGGYKLRDRNGNTLLRT